MAETTEARMRVRAAGLSASHPQPVSETVLRIGAVPCTLTVQAKTSEPPSSQPPTIPVLSAVRISP